MSAWQVREPGPVSGEPLERVERDVPAPAPGEVLVRVRCCGVCRTDLHVVEGDLTPHAVPVVPGHEVVGEVVARAPDVARFDLGDRVGIAWLRQTCGECRWCRAGAENLCRRSRYTGWDEDGGYAEYAVVQAAFAYAVPAQFSDIEAAPLLCAGIIGYRALRRSALPPGGRLGIYGFGASAHITAQVALAAGARVHVLTRDEVARELALELGATSVGGAYDDPPEPLDAAILFAPVGDLVPVALQALEQGGTLAVAGIHLTDIPLLNYEQHLFRERTLTSVTSNTRSDGEQLMSLAATLGIRVAATPYAFDQAPQALRDLRAGRVRGVAVLTMP